MYASSGSKLVHVVSYPRHVVMWNVTYKSRMLFYYTLFLPVGNVWLVKYSLRMSTNFLDQAPLRIAVTALSALGFCLALLSEHKEQTGRTAQKCKI